jgi:hypothetical protein
MRWRINKQFLIFRFRDFVISLGAGILTNRKISKSRNRQIVFFSLKKPSANPIAIGGDGFLFVNLKTTQAVLT